MKGGKNQTNKTNLKEDSMGTLMSNKMDFKANSLFQIKRTLTRNI